MTAELQVVTGFEAQNEIVFEKLKGIVRTFQERKECLIVEVGFWSIRFVFSFPAPKWVVVWFTIRRAHSYMYAFFLRQGVHLSIKHIQQLVSEYPHCIPFLIYISNQVPCVASVPPFISSHLPLFHSRCHLTAPMLIYALFPCRLNIQSALPFAQSTWPSSRALTSTSSTLGISASYKIIYVLKRTSGWLVPLYIFHQLYDMVDNVIYIPFLISYSIPHVNVSSTPPHI